MSFIATVLDITIVDFEVKEKINDNFLKDYISTNLNLKNIKIEKNQKIFINFVEKTKEYQLFIVDKSFKYFEYEIIKEIKEFDFIVFSLFICENFFVIFKDKKLYYLQKINQKIENSELLTFLDKKFNIDFKYIKNLSKDDLKILEDDFLRKSKKSYKQELKRVNLSKDFSFYFFVLYIFIFTIFSISYFKNEYEKDFALKNIDPNMILKNHEFVSFEDRFYKVLKDANSTFVDIIIFDYKTDFAKIVVESPNKDNINNFLNSFNKIEQSSINFLDDKDIFRATIDVKLSK
ncbi:hypothetical protein [Aliarcobacter skirrowii]|uniref:hypothetical protein n=1 Tax=Aliarcobacter skirrowii TaxID=28200 RepID=UPI0029ABFAA7|nr:hypothetical protein [Aliarcobacter skirrowii]MDX4028549.1 hypothetical protein [Aliarcobacter skirrowii]